MKEGWEYIALSSVCKVQNGFAFNSKLFNESNNGLPLIRIRDIKRGYSLTYTDEACSNDFYVEDGDMLIGMDGDFNIGEWKGGHALLNQRVCKLIPSEKILAKFIFYFIPEALQRINDKTAFSTVKHLSSKQVNAILLPNLPLSEQQSIVDYLDSAFAKIDAMKANAEKALNEAKALFQASLKEMLEPKEGWEESKLKDIVDEKCPISYGIVQQGDHVEGGIPVVRPVDLNRKYITANGLKCTTESISSSYKRTILRGDEILLGVRGTTGIIGIATEELNGCNVNRGVVPLFFKDTICRDFIFYEMLSPAIQAVFAEKTTGATLKQINIKDLRTIVFSYPIIEIQQSIVDTLDSLKSKVDRLQENYDKISLECDALKQAILRKVFEG